MELKQPHPESVPTTEQAIKILKKLAEEYSEGVPPEEQPYLEDYLQALDPNDRDFESNVKTISNILRREITLFAAIAEENLLEFRVTAESSAFALLTWDENMPRTGDLHIPFEEAAAMHEYDQNNLYNAAMKLDEARTDLRSLDRAVTAITQPQSAPVTEYDALLQIMRIG